MYRRSAPPRLYAENDPVDPAEKGRRQRREGHEIRSRGIPGAARHEAGCRWAVKLRIALENGQNRLGLIHMSAKM
jgi:hypothetical protein